MAPSNLKSASKWILANLTPRVRPDGFEFLKPCYFVRSRGPLLDAFFFNVLRPDSRSFCICYGLDAPELLLTFSQRVAPAADAPRLWVSSYLMQQRWYSCWDQQKTEASVGVAVSDLRNEALPWFGRFKKVRDLVDCYYDREIAPDPHLDGEPHPGSPRRWAQYGFMLLECGSADEARTWLRSAYDYLQRPLFTDGSRFSFAKFPRSRAMKSTSTDLAVAEMIKEAGYAR